MKNTYSPKSELSTQSYPAFETQTRSYKAQKPNSSTNTTKTFSSTRSGMSRTDEVNIAKWNLSEKISREYDRNFNGQRLRSPNFKINLVGTLSMTNQDENKNSKFEKHKDLRVRDFSSNINTLPNSDHALPKKATEVEFLTSPKHRTVLSSLTNDTFYFKASSNSSIVSENTGKEQFRAYNNRTVKQFELPNRKKNTERELFLFHSPRNF